jgi:hypothetical protein
MAEQLLPKKFLNPNRLPVDLHPVHSGGHFLLAAQIFQAY